MAVNSVRSSRIRPVSWSTSYLFLPPLGISTVTSNVMPLNGFASFSALGAVTETSLGWAWLADARGAPTAGSSLSEGWSQVRAKRTVLAAVAMIITVGVVVGFVTGAFTSLARAGLYATGLWSTNGPSVLPSTSSAPPAPSASPSRPPATPSSTRSTPAPADLPDPVLAGADTRVRPDPVKVKTKIAGVRVKNSQGRLSGSVLEVTSGTAVFRQQAGRALIPASTMKLLTSAAVLSALGPDHTFRTSVVSPKRGEIDLGRRRRSLSVTKKSKADTFPRRASVADLARSTATALRQAQDQKRPAGLRRPAVRRPGLEPGLAERLRRPGTPVSALWVDEGRLGWPDPRDRGRRTRPGRPPTAYRGGAAQAAASGSAVTGKAKAPRTAARVASVSSMPLGARSSSRC